MRLLIISFVILILTACSSEDVETANFGSDLFKSDYLFINATDYELDFYMRNHKIDGDERNPDGEDYLVAHAAIKGETVTVEHEHNSGREVAILGRAPYAMNIEDQVSFKARLERKYNVLAWHNGGNLALNVFKRYESDVSDKIRVRIFSTQPDLEVEHGGNEFNLQRGEVSDFISIEHCDDQLMVNQQPISLCDASFGRSYLLVVGAQGKEILVRQH